MESTLLIQLFLPLLPLPGQLQCFSNPVDHQEIFVGELVFRGQDNVDVAIHETFIGSLHHFATVLRGQLPGVLLMPRANKSSGGAL